MSTVPIPRVATTALTPALVTSRPLTLPTAAPTRMARAIDAASGKVEWNQEFGSALFGAPTVINDVVFATSFEGNVHALDTAGGGELWVGTLPASINTGVSISGDTVVAPAGLASAEGQAPAIVAYRLGD